jgi:hypothetical protein
MIPNTIFKLSEQKSTIVMSLDKINFLTSLMNHIIDRCVAVYTIHIKEHK